MSAVIHEEMQEKAFRLMEALSGVDEELLARSEAAGASADRKKQGGRAFVWRYGKYLAACFVFLVLGVSAYSVGRFSYDGSKTESSNESAGGAGDSGRSEDSCAVQSNESMAQVAPEEAFSGAGLAEEGSTAAAADSMNGMSAAATKESVQQEMEEDVARDNVSAIAEYSQKMTGYQAITLEAARELDVVGAYIPKTLPEGYQFVECLILREQEGGGYDIELSFQNAGGSDVRDIVLRITDCCAAAKSQGDADLQEQINRMWPEQKEDRTFVTSENLTAEIFSVHTTVAVVYDSGVVVQYTGEGTPEEISKMFLSVS
ncbi:MAG: hypothetical protein NC417_09460 [Candidatus Gastranaerophilales bacterium]|nr:hypothetical protein [Candidatus Gastranaerophilales bacterium]